MIDRKRGGGLVWVLGIMFGQLSFDTSEPFIERGCGRALSAGKEPITPALHWAMTRSGVEMMNIGAPITGIRIADLIFDMAFMDISR